MTRHPARHRTSEKVRDGAAHRAVATWQTCAALLLFVVLAAVLIPWGVNQSSSPVRPGELFTAAEIERAESYASAARGWSWTALAVSLAFAAAVGFTSWGRAVMARLPGVWWVRVLLGVAAYATTHTVLTFGFRVGAWRLRRDVGLSTQEWDSFLRDSAVSWCLEMVSLGVLMVIVVGLARRFARVWTLVAGALAALLVVAMSYVYPAVVEPLFNDFTALPSGELRDRIAGMAEAEGVVVSDVVVADASRRTTTLNAWVSGFGDTQRVVLYDNLIEEATSDEVMSVVAHELAHARHDDVLIGTMLGAVGAMAAVAVLGLVVAGSKRAGIGEPRVVPLVLACLTIGSQLMAPIENGISRVVETRADLESLCLTQDPEAFEALHVRLATRSLNDPEPPAWAQWWWGGHPMATQRIGLAHNLTGAQLCTSS